ncbi:MAG: 2-amino-4-hydroxy-6-hydroxymethyldihydropteridine diphosphokinase, partial [Paracoccaceae bacterium]
TASRFYSTPCFPPGAGPDYVNAAAQVAYRGPVEDFLQKLHAIEAQFGRERVERWGRRTLDLDLIAVGDLVLPDAAGHQQWRDLPPEHQASLAPDQLILPHPRVQDRGFVLVPLADIAADWVHPVLGRSVADMVAALPAKDRADVRAL